MNNKNIFFLIIFSSSLLLNLFTFVEYINQPTYQPGIINEDLKVTDFSKQKVLFTLPKGLVVLNASPRGIASAGLFSPYRFTFTIIDPRTDSIEYDLDTPPPYPKALYFSNPEK